MARNRPTIADVRANKGKLQYTMMRTENWEELAAAEAAGIDMVSVTPDMMTDPRFRDLAPSLFAVPGVNFYDVGSTDEFIRWSFRMLKAGADASLRDRDGKLAVDLAPSDELRQVFAGAEHQRPAR